MKIEIERGTCNAWLPKGTVIHDQRHGDVHVLDCTGDYSTLYDAAGKMHVFIGTPRTVAEWNAGRPVPTDVDQYVALREALR